MEKKNYIKKTVFAAIIAASYAALTYLSGIIGLGYGPIQIRLSEILTVLPVFSPSAVLGLTVGCFIANIGSFNPLDMLIGTSATLIAALFSRLLRNVKVFSLPLLSFLSPVIVNAFIIGTEISYIFVNNSVSFPLTVAVLALEEALVCLGFGIPFYLALKKHESELKDFF